MAAGRGPTSRLAASTFRSTGPVAHGERPGGARRARAVPARRYRHAHEAGHAARGVVPAREPDARLPKQPWQRFKRLARHLKPAPPWFVLVVHDGWQGRLTRWFFCPKRSRIGPRHAGRRPAGVHFQLLGPARAAWKPGGRARGIRSAGPPRAQRGCSFPVGRGLAEPRSCGRARGVRAS